MTAPEPLGSAWHFTTLHSEDLSAPPPHTISSCRLLLLITGNLRTTHIQSKRDQPRRRVDRPERLLMGVGIHIRFYMNVFFYVTKFFFCCLSVTFALHSVCDSFWCVVNTASVSPLTTCWLQVYLSSTQAFLPPVLPVHVYMLMAVCVCVCMW